MRKAEIFCVITYPKNTVAASRMIGAPYGFDGARGTLVYKSGDLLTKTLVTLEKPDTWEIGHGSVLVFQNEIIIRDSDRRGDDGRSFLEFSMTPRRCPVIYVESHLTQMNEYAVAFFEGKDDRMLLCVIRAVSREEAGEFRRLVRRFLFDNHYKHLGGGVYEKASRP